MKFIIFGSLLLECLSCCLGISLSSSLSLGAVAFNEMGPLPFGETQTIQGSGTSFRVQSFGNTVISLTVKGSQNGLPQISFEGPLDDNGDSVAPGSGPQYRANDPRISKSGQALNVQATLSQAGVYRVLLPPVTATEPLYIRGECLSGCNRHEISASEFISRLKARGILDSAETYLTTMFQKYSGDANLSAKLVQGLKNLISQNPARFPTVSLSQIGAFQPVVGEAEMLAASQKKTERIPDPVVSGDLITALNTLGKFTREPPPPVDKRLPGIGNGDFINLALTKDQIIQSSGLAQVLTSLALNNGSSVTFNGKTFSSPGPLLAELAATGHRIKVADQRTYANFISFNDGDDVVRWPSWLDTGLKMPSGAEVIVPMSHAQLAWEITGPVVNARLTFFLGISGAGFFPNIHTRPAWTGLRETRLPTALVSQIAETAATYLRRDRTEANIYAKGLANDGYGVTEGVCCDSVAAVEAKLNLLQFETPYPLLRSTKLKTPLQDGFDDVLSALPHDTQVPPSSDKALATRIEAMIPSTNIPWDTELQKTAIELRAIVAKGAGSDASPSLVQNCVAGMNEVAPVSSTSGK